MMQSWQWQRLTWLKLPLVAVLNRGQQERARRPVSLPVRGYPQAAHFVWEGLTV